MITLQLSDKQACRDIITIKKARLSEELLYKANTGTKKKVSIFFLATSRKDVKDVPIEDTTKNNTKMIVIVLTLLASSISIILIVLYVMYVRRRSFKKQGNSYSSIHLFTVKQISFCYTKLISQRLLVILTFIHKIFFVKYLFPAEFRGLKLLPGQNWFWFFNI